MANLTKEQKERYCRQTVLPNVGEAGQEKLLDSKVLIIGTGGLGSPVSLYLTSAGVGKVGIMDGDVVELSNLQRQIVHSTGKLGVTKTSSAKERLSNLNPDVEIVDYEMRASADNILSIVKEYDIVADCTDNYPTRYLMNDACVIAKKPLVHGGMFRFEGQAITIVPGKGPCYRCLFPEPPPPGIVAGGAEAGILGAVAGVIGAVMANEVLKVLLDTGKLLTGKLLFFDALDSSFRTMPVRRDENCAVCGKQPTITELTC